MIYIPETEKIYFSKSREYFNEVISCYANGNYRSAVVMLYSVAVCDLLFKLKELVDMYDDTIAKEILHEIDKSRNNDNKSKARWEKEIIDKIYDKTELLDLESYTNLNHLYDHRNFSAHPALNAEYELISPSQETTIAHIKNVMEDILTKPPVFIKNIFDMLTEDLSEKRVIYDDEPEKLKQYLCRKYFDWMPLSMKKSTFRSLWKLCFCLPDDEECMRNMKINRRAMEILFDITPEMINYVQSDKMFENVSTDDTCTINLCILLARYPQIYQVMSEDIKLNIRSLIGKNNDAKLISWFICGDKVNHINEMIENKEFASVSPETIAYVSSQYSLEGILSKFIDYCIGYYGASTTYDKANERYRRCIKPYLDKLDREQFVNLISVSNENDQIYGRNSAYLTATEIAKASKEYLNDEFEFENYTNFRFDRNEVFDKTIKDEGDIFDDIPF